MIGLVGIMMPNFKELTLSLSFLNLLLAFAVILLAEDESKSLLMKYLLIAFIIGIVVELIGVHTGLLFGDYKYGSNLGPKFWGVPLVIGINWGVLSITAASITHSIKWPYPLKIILNAFVLVIFDFVMEPVAMKSDFWSWRDDTIPLFNYVCWFFVAVILQLIYFRMRKPNSNKVYNALFFIQFIFFIILNLR